MLVGAKFHKIKKNLMMDLLDRSKMFRRNKVDKTSSTTVLNKWANREAFNI